MSRQSRLTDELIQAIKKESAGAAIAALSKTQEEITGKSAFDSKAENIYLPIHQEHKQGWLDYFKGFLELPSIEGPDSEGVLKGEPVIIKLAEMAATKGDEWLRVLAMALFIGASDETQSTASKSVKQILVEAGKDQAVSEQVKAYEEQVNTSIFSNAMIKAINDRNGTMALTAMRSTSIQSTSPFVARKEGHQKLLDYFVAYLQSPNVRGPGIEALNGEPIIIAMTRQNLSDSNWCLAIGMALFLGVDPMTQSTSGETLANLIVLSGHGDEILGDLNQYLRGSEEQTCRSWGDLGATATAPVFIPEEDYEVAMLQFDELPKQAATSRVRFPFASGKKEEKKQAEDTSQSFDITGTQFDF